MIIEFLQSALAWLARLVCGISTFTKEINLDQMQQAIYYANHSSNFDFLAVWSSLPGPLRRRTRPVAARDYWGKPGIKSFLSQRIFRSILIDRNRTATGNPLADVSEALRNGDSVIIFPEGTRSLDGTLQEFKSGLYHLAQEFPQLPLVPVYLQNLNRVLPKGEVLMVPLLSRVIFGHPIGLDAAEEKADFLKRARESLQELA